MTEKNKNQWLKQVENEIGEVKLNGLKVTCPECGEKGLLFSRWVEGLQEKPKYVLHLNKAQVSSACEVTKDVASELKTQVKILKSDIIKLLSKRKCFVLFSGGKDSVCLLAYLKELLNGTKTNLTALFIDTTVGMPENQKYVKKVCKYLKVPLKIVRPRRDYFELVNKWGIPSHNSRWCCEELKIKPVRDYLSTVKEPKVVFDGIRAAESNVRATYLPIWYHPAFKCLSVSPIFYWSNEKVHTFINKNGIPKNKQHALGTSTECWCGAYKRKSDFEALYQVNPELFKKLMKVEKNSKTGFTYLYQKGKRIPLRSLIKEVKDKTAK